MIAKTTAAAQAADRKATSTPHNDASAPAATPPGSIIPTSIWYTPVTRPRNSSGVKDWTVVKLVVKTTCKKACWTATTIIASQSTVT